MAVSKKIISLYLSLELVKTETIRTIITIITIIIIITTITTDIIFRETYHRYTICLLNFIFY